MKEAFGFLKFCDIIKANIWAEVDDISLKHFDKVCIRSLAIRITIEQKGRFTVLLFHDFVRRLLDSFVDVVYIKIFSTTTLRLLCYFGFALILFELELGRIPDIRIFVDDFFRHHVIIGFWNIHAVVSGCGPEIGFCLIEVFTVIEFFRGI